MHERFRGDSRRGALPGGAGGPGHLGAGAGQLLPPARGAHAVRARWDPRRRHQRRLPGDRHPGPGPAGAGRSGRTPGGLRHGQRSGPGLGHRHGLPGAGRRAPGAGGSRPAGGLDGAQRRPSRPATAGCPGHRVQRRGETGGLRPGDHFLLEEGGPGLPPEPGPFAQSLGAALAKALATGRPEAAVLRAARRRTGPPGGTRPAALRPLDFRRRRAFPPHRPPGQGTGLVRGDRRPPSGHGHPGAVPPGGPDRRGPSPRVPAGPAPGPAHRRAGGEPCLRKGPARPGSPDPGSAGLPGAAGEPGTQPPDHARPGRGRPGPHRGAAADSALPRRPGHRRRDP